MSKEAEVKERAAETEDDKPKNFLERGVHDGISLNFFKKNCQFLSGCLP